MQGKQKRAYLYRFYPTDEQARILARTFGCVRFAYNWALRLRTDAYVQEQKRVSYYDTSSQLTRLKQKDDRAWLKEVSSVPLQQALRHLERAFRNFFEGRAACPKFKSKHGVQSAEYTTSAFVWDGRQLALAKMEEPLHIIWSRPLPGGCKPTTVTVTKDTANRYFVSLLVEEDINALPVTAQMVGVDVGIKAMVALSSGEAVENPRFYVKADKRLARAQRRLSRKKKGSKNRAKARSKVARLHTKIADKRRDFQHKLSTRIIRENQVICVESLSVKNMLKNHCLAKHISDVGWGEFVRQWSTSPPGMGAPWPRSIAGTRRVKRVAVVSMCLKPFHWMNGSGRAPHVALSMTVISMRVKTFLPRGSRCMPVEGESDLFE